MEWCVVGGRQQGYRLIIPSLDPRHFPNSPPRAMQIDTTSSPLDISLSSRDHQL